MVQDHRIESEAEFGDCSKESDSSFEYQEQKKKPKKLRSIRKLNRFPSLRSSTRRGIKSNSATCTGNALAGYAASSEQSTPVEMSDASSQKSARVFLRRLSFRQAKVKKSRSIKLDNSHYEQYYVESSSGSNQSSKHSNPNSLSFPGTQSKKSLVRISSLKKPVRIFTKSKISRFQSSTVQKATCSSAFKESKHVKPGEPEASSMTTKVCTYSYCSLHGHRHADVPPLKRFVSMRRRALKSQKSIKPESQVVPKTTKRRVQRQQRDSTVNHTVREKSHDGNEDTFVRYTGPKSRENQSVTVDFPEEGHQHTFTNECDNLPLEHDDDIRSTGHSEIQIHGEFQQEFKEDNVSNLKLKKPKNFRLWHLIYQNMVTGLETEAETQSSSSGLNKEQAEDHVPTLLEVNSLKSSPDRHEKIPEVNMDDGFQKNELYKSDAVKLVKEAFDRILAEIPDQPSDYQSVTSETSYQEIVEEKDGTDSVTDSVVQSPKETQLKGTNFSTSTDEKITDGNKSNRQGLKNWNSLKKVIVLKRFVKTLEKVKNINPQEPRYLASEQELEAEKVRLKQLSIDGKKNSEEWMLDYSLQQVIGSLAPAQKRKVALLVQAFETVIPLPGIETRLTSSPAESTQKTPSRVYKEPSDKNAVETWKENSFGVTLSKRSHTNDYPDQVSEISRVERKIQAPRRAQLEETSSGNVWTKLALGMLASDTINKNSRFTIEQDRCDSRKQEEPRVSARSLDPYGSVTDSIEKTQLNVKTFQEVLGQETRDGDPEINNVKPDTVIVSSSNQEYSPVDRQNLPRSIEDTVSSSNLATQKSFTLWHLIHQQMKTGLDTEAPNQPYGTEADLNVITDIHDDSRQKVELYKTNAIKMVQEAFDKILSEIPDNSSDNQSVTSETTSHQELIEEHHADGNEQRLSKSDSTSDMKVEDPERKSLKNWSNLKKIIIFKRFVKALEKVRDINPQKPQDLNRETEKVYLRHQTTAERKYAESETEKVNLKHRMEAERNYGDKWMLDYALRNVISTLAPAQKRKVALMVQAFETVIPPEAKVESSPRISDRAQKENNYGGSLPKSARHDISLIENSNQVHEGEEPRSCHVPTPKPDSGSTHTTEQIPVTDGILKDNTVQETPISDSEVHDGEKLEPTRSNNVEHVTESEKQNYKKLWYFVYKHTASSSEAKEENQPFIEEGDVKLRQIEAMRLVEEAIDEIQDDSSDIQSVASDKNPDDEFTENKSDSTSTDNSFEKLEVEQIPQESRPTAKKNWSNLKKKILLKRFIKALEKVKGPNYQQPKKPDPEAEKVRLRQQDTLGRRNSEEWMLDHAMQQVVATLTPARKRKVALLVQAFESVAN